MGSLFSPFLYTGDTLASFYSSGKIPVVIDKFITWVKDGATIGAASFISRRQDMPSRPLALFNGSELISFIYDSIVGRLCQSQVL